MRLMIVITDLDGTLSDAEHRVHLIERNPKNWDAFFEASRDDAPIWPVIRVVQALQAAGHQIHVLTGRSDSTREATVAWLEAHEVPFDRLLMRSAGDYTPDDRLKRDWFVQDYKPEDVLLVLDDRARVVRMWREFGLVCLQVAPGDF